MMNTHINDLQEQLARVCAERDALKDALEPIVSSASHTRVFLTSRERMHPAGIALYDADIRQARAVLGLEEEAPPDAPPDRSRVTLIVLGVLVALMFYCMKQVYAP